MISFQTELDNSSLSLDQTISDQIRKILQITQSSISTAESFTEGSLQYSLLNILKDTDCFLGGIMIPGQNHLF